VSGTEPVVAGYPARPEDVASPGGDVRGVPV